MKNRVLAIATVFGLFTMLPLRAATIQLVGNDGPDQHSYSTGANWSDGLAPSMGNDYVVDGFRIRVEDQNVTFQGDSLTLSGGATMNVKTTSFVRTNNLIVDGARIVAIQTGGTFLEGNLSLGASGLTLEPENGDIRMQMIVSGGGALAIDVGRQPERQVRIQQTNSYIGGTTVLSGGNLRVEADGGLGTGDVMVEAGAGLTLVGGLSNDYIDNSATLVLAGTSMLALDYTGSDSIVGLSLDGGSTFAESGLWGAVGNLSADFTSSLITGDGLIHVIPESNAYGFLVGMGSMLMLFYRRRRPSS